jgi:hypothetical protein
MTAELLIDVFLSVIWIRSEDADSRERLTVPLTSLVVIASVLRYLLSRAGHQGNHM